MSEPSQVYSRCVHFRGIQNTCDADVDPMGVRDTSTPGMARFPCLRLIGREAATTTCRYLRVMTADELAQEEAQTNAAVDKMLADLKGGRCPHCQASIGKRKRVGRCEYAEPCGHRIGQVLDEGDEP